MTDQGPPRPTDPMIVSTTDPAVAAEAEHQADWKRHPFATIRLETAPTGGPELRAVASPWAVELAPPHPPGPQPPAPPPVPAARPPDPGIGAGARAPRPAEEPSPPRPRPRPRARMARFPWLVVGAALLGGLIGSAGYLAIAGSRRRPPAAS